MTRLRAGLIGAGYGQRVIAPALLHTDRFEIANVAAGSPESASTMAAALDVAKHAGDWRDIVADADVDAVFIAVPPPLQPEIALAAIAAGKAVWCEKPLASELGSAARIKAAADDAQVPNMIDFIFPEVPAWARAKEMIDAGAVGTPRHIAVTWHVQTYANRHRIRSWKTRTAEGGGTLFNFVPHVFHYLEWLFGPIAEMSAALLGGADDTDGGDLHDVFALRFQAGASAAVSICTDAIHGEGHSLSCFGTEGALVLENKTADPVFGFQLRAGAAQAEQLQPVDLPPLVGEGDGRVFAVARLAERFAEWIGAGQAARPDFGDGLRVQALLDAARRSHASRSWRPTA